MLRCPSIYSSITNEYRPFVFNCNYKQLIFSCLHLFFRTKTLRPLFCSEANILDSYINATNMGNKFAFREVFGVNSSCPYDRGSVGGCNNYDIRKVMMPFDPNFQVRFFHTSVP